MADERALAEKLEWTVGISRLVRERRSIRSFEKQPLAQEVVMERLQAAVQSVSPEGRKPACRFIYIDSHEGKEKAVSLIMHTYAEQKLYKWLLSKMNQLMADRIMKIPAFLVVIQEMAEDPEKCDQDYATICALLQSFSLLAWECGIGLVWNTEPFLQKESFSTGMGLQPGEQIVSMLFMGNYERIPSAKQRTSAWKRITFV